MSQIAIVHGAAPPPPDSLPASYGSAIAARVVEHPDGRLWEYALDGCHASESYSSLVEDLRADAFRVLPLEALAASTARLRHIEIDPADPAVFLSSSGTTGTPKLLVLTHGNLLYRYHPGLGVPGQSALTALTWFPLDGVTGLRATGTHYRDFVYVPSQIATAHPLSLLDAADHFRSAYLPVTSHLAERIVEVTHGADLH